jgi:RsiW-degrading membrane proteinase PrsW (M82 family)
MTAEQPVATDEPEFKLTRGAVFPLVGGRSTWAHEHLLPIVATLMAGLALMVLFDPTLSGQDVISHAWGVYAVLGLYIAFIVNYYVNEMCGRPKRLWLLAVVALFTFLVGDTWLWNLCYAFFYYVIPGQAAEKSANFLTSATGYFFGTGLCEELFKALPLFVLMLVGAVIARRVRNAGSRPIRFWRGVRRHIALCEPLDGIVMGAASGSGFFLNETLGQYVPQLMHAAKYPGSQAYNGLVVLLARGIPELAEHSAWAGLFGYFIGLSVLRPRMAVGLLLLGWCSAAALHGAWDFVGNLDNPIVVISFWLVLGVLSYGLLAGAIFKGLDISPRRNAEAAKAAAAQADALARVRNTPPTLPPPLVVDDSG